MPPEPSQPDSGVRVGATGGDGPWITFCGLRFRNTGDGCFQFISRSDPRIWYEMDIFTPPYCTCHPARTSPPCVHLNVLKLYLKKLRNEKHL